MAKLASQAGLLGLSFEVMGVPQVARVLAVSIDAIKDLRPVWDDIATDFAKKEQTVFDRQGAVAGWSEWEALNKDYKDWKVSKGWSPKIMVKGGRLMHSLTNKSSGDFILGKHPKYMEIGTRVPYAKYHQDARPPRKKREVIRVTDAQRRLWVRMIQKFIIDSGQFERANLVQTKAGKGFKQSRWITAS